MTKRTMQDFIDVIENAELTEYDVNEPKPGPGRGDGMGPRAKRIMHQKNILPSKLTFEGTRLGVYEIANYAQTESKEWILDNWPELTEADIEAAVEFEKNNPE